MTTQHTNAAHSTETCTDCGIDGHTNCARGQRALAAVNALALANEARRHAENVRQIAASASALR